jgi:predicted porin
VFGGGITPKTGLRVGASFAIGRYAHEEEVTDPLRAARRLGMWTVEGDYAFGYTKLAGEFTRQRFTRGQRTTVFDPATVANTASTWWLQGTQTLTPRIFVSGRHEVIDAPPPLSAGPAGSRMAFRMTEAAVGYRLTPDLTVRGELMLQRFFTARAADRRGGVQLVWSRRWW